MTPDGSILSILFRILPVFLMIFLGVVARRRGLVDGPGTRMLAVLLTHLFYPALIFSSITASFTLPELLQNWTLPAGALLIMATGCLIGLAASRLVDLRRTGERRSFLFQCTINNYAFLPLPLVMAFWGEKAVGQLVFSTLGSEFAVWTIGVYLLSGHRPGRGALRHLLSVPMCAMLAALCVVVARAGIGHAGWEAWFSQGLIARTGSSISWGLTLFGNATVPMAMVVAGSRMAALRRADIMAAHQYLLVVLRLIVVPAAVLTLLMLLPFPEQARRVLMLIAVMPSAIASVTLSELYRADAAFAASTVLLTHVVCLVTVPVWLWLLF